MNAQDLIGRRTGGKGSGYDQTPWRVLISLSFSFILYLILTCKHMDSIKNKEKKCFNLVAQNCTSTIKISISYVFVVNIYAPYVIRVFSFSTILYFSMSALICIRIFPKNLL